MKVELLINNEQFENGLSTILSWADDSMVSVWSPKFSWCAKQDDNYPNLFICLQNSNGNVIGLGLTDDGQQSVIIDSSRHALWSNNSVSDVMEALGFYQWQNTDEVGRGWGQISASDAAKSARVLSYDSMRKDRPWWSVGLRHPAVKQYQDKLKAATIDRPAPLDSFGDPMEMRWNEYHRKVMWYDTGYCGASHEAFQPIRPFTAKEYRRAYASGITI